MGAKTVSKANESVTPPPKDSKKQKFAGAMMADAFDPDMLCFYTQQDEEDEFETMPLRPYSVLLSWLKKKLPSLTDSDWYTASKQELALEYEVGILTSWEYSVENDKLLDVMTGNGIRDRNVSSIIWEAKAPDYDMHLTDADCLGRTADDELILHNHVEINCLYSAVLQLVYLRDQVVEYDGGTPPTPSNPKLAKLQQFKGKELQEHSNAFRQYVQEHATHLSQNMGVTRHSHRGRGTF